MTDVSQGPDWWQAADLMWYPPELHADYVAPPVPPPDEQPRQPPPSQPPGDGPGQGWWQAADLKWYPPEQHADYEEPTPPDEQPQQPGDLDLAATQQRPPGWAPVPPARPADRPPPQIGTPPPPRGGRKPLTIAAGAVIAVAVTATVVHLLTGRNSQPSTISQPSATAQPSTTISQTVAPVAEAALDGLLLSLDQISSVMGATGMTVLGLNPTTWYSESDNLPDKACVPLWGPADRVAYEGSGSTSVYGQWLGSSNNESISVRQNVVLFPSARDANAFFTASAQRWPACSNRNYTHTFGAGSIWTVGPVINTNGTLIATQTANDGATCQRTLTVANNVTIDVEACGTNPADSAVNIAQQIAAKVPTT